MNAATASDSPNPILVDAGRAAMLLSISRRTLFAYTKAGHIPCVRVGSLVRYRVKDLEKWAEENVSARPAAEEVA